MTRTLLLWLTASLALQTPGVIARQQGLAVITGTVRDAATGAAIPFAQITMNLFDRGTRAARADEHGRFRIEAPAGLYTLRVLKPGYAPADFGIQPGSLMPGSLAAGDEIDVTISVAKGAVITGRVIDEFGDPAAYQPIHVSGTGPGVTVGFPFAEPEFGGKYATDMRGQYRLFGLPAGEYVVRVGPYGSRESVDEWRRVGRVPIYFSNVTEPSQATKIVLRAGEERDGVDFTLRSVPLWRIEGRIDSPFEIEDRWVSISLADRGGKVMSLNYTQSLGPDGRFIVEGAAAGSYLMAVTATQAGTREGADSGRQLWSVTPVGVGAGHVTGLIVNLERAVSVTGRVDGLGDSPLDRALPAGVWLEPLDPSPVHLPFQPAKTDRSGAFRLASVRPGRYRIEVRRGFLPSEYLVSSVTVAGRAAPGPEIHVTGDIADVVVTVRRKSQDSAESGTRAASGAAGS
jgi:hypothetical protein